ncbi:MAG: GDSL-type esterase/lipase family protein [Verrucomicrobiales bacterium]|nr:GDSL-type esterase/lipase family protein [Verrucomicrobiales bacterium]
MKIKFILIPIICLSTALSATAKDEAKPLALTPVPHPGKEKSHESFNEISKKGEASVVFLGDSITAGWNGRGKEVWEKTWAPIGAVNFGIGGDRTEHILWRLENGNYDGLKPELTVLMIGTNNTGHSGREVAEHGGVVYNSSAEETAEGVKAIIGKLQKKQPQMKILLLAIFPRGADSSDEKRKKNEVTNQIISKLHDGEKVWFLDINDKFLEEDGTLSKEIMPDLLHPNQKGYEIWAEAIEPKVKELLDK